GARSARPPGAPGGRGRPDARAGATAWRPGRVSGDGGPGSSPRAGERRQRTLPEATRRTVHSGCRGPAGFQGRGGVTAMAAVRAGVLEGFDDPTLGPAAWEDLLGRGESPVVFLTWHWQRSWWDSFGRGQLLLIVVESQGRVVALAPLFAEAGMIFFVGSGGS